MGKGRQIAAVIKEFWASGGRRMLWVSTSNDLRYDARRDLSDLGVDESTIPVLPPVSDLHLGDMVSGECIWCTVLLAHCEGMDCRVVWKSLIPSMWIAMK